QVLNKAVFGSESPNAAVPLIEPMIYRQYLFGARYLEQYFLAETDYFTATKISSALVWGSILMLAITAWMRSPWIGIAVTPIVAYLLLNFGVTRLITLGSAPGFYAV